MEKPARPIRRRRLRPRRYKLTRIQNPPRPRRGKGNDPVVEARVCYGDGGGILIDFRITKDATGPRLIESWAKGANLTGEIPYPLSTPSSGTSCGPAHALIPDKGVQQESFFKAIGETLNKAWVWARLTLDDPAGTQVEYKLRWTISPNPSFVFKGMTKV